MAYKLTGHGNSFHDWLAASAYVTGADQTARVVSRKKHRSKRNPAASDLESARLETEQQVRVVWKLSNRHYRRWMNDRLLRELAPPLDAQEIGSLFAPPPWGEKSVVRPFERVMGLGENAADDMAAWEPFRNNVDMDAEAKALLQKPRPCTKKDGEVLRHNAALAAWRRIGRQARDALRRSSSWHLVEGFEEKVLTFLAEVQKGGPNSLVLEVDDAYHRMLLHGICEFHGLVSQTVSHVDDSRSNCICSTMSRVHVRKRTASKLDAALSDKSPVTLLQFLLGSRRMLPVMAAAA